jgi:uncharacterized protein DUF1579
VIEISRKRLPGITDQHPAVAKNAKAMTDKAHEAAMPAAAPAKDAAQQELDKHLGKWNVVMTMPTPDGKTSEDKGTENCTAVWDSGPMWTDFNTTFMGGKFEGHGLVITDPVTKKVTNYWVDSMSPYMSVLTGAYDAKTKTISASGKCLDEMGEEGTMTESISWKDENTRINDMSMTGKTGTMKWTITSTRAK